jgi:hypothetical protein
MIKDDFDVEGSPNPRVWKSFGASTCKGGLLKLPSSTDYVISVEKVGIDESAVITVVFASGFGSLELTRYDLLMPPSRVAEIPYDSVIIESGPKVVFCSNGVRVASMAVYSPITVTLQSSKNEWLVYVEGKDFWGKPYPKTLMCKTKNQFYGADVFIHLVGGSLAVDSIYASAGRESLSAQMTILLSSVMAIIPLLMFLPIVRMLRGIVKPEEKY